MDEKRTRAERRHNDWKKAIRKQKIVRQSVILPDWYDNLHQYSKNKIHCSCPMCAMKTNNKGKRGNSWEKPYSPPAHDIKQLEDNIDELIEEARLMDIDNAFWEEQEKINR